MCGLIKKEEGTRSYDFSSLVLHLVNCDKNLANILPDSSLKKKKKKGNPIVVRLFRDTKWIGKYSHLF